MGKALPTDVLFQVLHPKNKHGKAHLEKEKQLQTSKFLVFRVSFRGCTWVYFKRYPHESFVSLPWTRCWVIFPWGLHSDPPSFCRFWLLLNQLTAPFLGGFLGVADGPIPDGSTFGTAQQARYITLQFHLLRRKPQKKKSCASCVSCRVCEAQTHETFPNILLF